MRGLVMEVKENMLVVLTPAGEYVRIKNPGSAAIGEMIDFDRPMPARAVGLPRRLAVAAASVLLACSAGLATYGYSQPFGVVSIDINPSVALTYNWFQRVIAAEAVNADGKQLLSQLGNLKHEAVSDAVDRIIAKAGKEGYLDPTLANVVFVSVSDSGSASRTESLVNRLEADFRTLPQTTETVLLTGTPQTYATAAAGHASPVKGLLNASLNGENGPAPRIHSGRTLKDVLEVQEEQRQRHAPPDTPAANTDSHEPNNDSKKTEHNSETPDTKDSGTGKGIPSKDERKISNPASDKATTPSSLVPSPSESSHDEPGSTEDNNGKGPDKPDKAKKEHRNND